MKGLICRSLLLGSLLSLVPISTTASDVKEVSPGVFEWTIQAPALDAISIDKNGIEIHGWNVSVDGNGFKVPVLSKLVYTHGEEPTVRIHEGSFTELHLHHQMSALKEQVKGLNLSPGPHTLNSRNDRIHIEFIGKEGTKSLWAVSYFGAQLDPIQALGKVPSDPITLNIRSGIENGDASQRNELFLNRPRENRNLSRPVTTGLGIGKIKFHVLRDGIYRIYFDDIQDLDGVHDQPISSRSLRLFNRGEEQPLFVEDGRDGVFDRGDFFDFIGKQNYFSGSTQHYDPFSDINVYWLDWGDAKGRRFVEESGALVSNNAVQPTSFWDVAHLEEDIIFDRLGRVDTDKPTITRDHYFWSSVNSGQNVEVDFFLPDPARGSSENIEVEVGLHGLTYSEGDGLGGEHTIYAFINDNSIGNASWTQQEEYTLVSPRSLNLSHNILSSSGQNTLEVFAPVSTQAGVYDRIVVNWLELGYERLLRAQGDRLRFRKSHLNPSTNLEFELTGFHSPNMVIYKESLSKITGYQIREVWDSGGQSFNLVFQDEVSDATPDYWTSTVDSLMQPVFSIADTLADLRNQDGDFIIITTPDLVYQFEEYVAFKQSEGWDPIVVSLSDIFDEFNYGLKSPFAIKSFLRYANNYWPAEPSHVMLVGDASINPQNEKRDVTLQNVPTFYMQTFAWGAAEADYWYTLINGDDYVPDLSIGRLPVGDRAELEATLAKLIRYQGELPNGSWQNEIITIAGFETTFKTQSENILKREVPEGIMPSRVFIDRNSEGDIFWGDTDSLIDLWNDGKLLINFLGHGGGAVWADRSLFVREDVALLDEETPPALVTSMTCFTGSFAQTEGLGEVVVTGSPTGAIGWLGSSGVGWLINDYLMIQPMMRRLLEEDRTVGEIMNTARIEYFIAPAATASDGTDLRPSMLFQYNYLGDPTTKLRLAQKSDLLESSQSIYDQDDQISIQTSANASGTLKILPINADGKPWWTHPQEIEISGGESFQIDQEPIIYNSDSTNILQPKRGMGRVIYTLDQGLNETTLQGYVPYGISSDWIEHQPLTANSIAQNPNFDLTARPHTEAGSTDSMTITFSGGLTQTFNMVQSNDWWVTPSTMVIPRTDRKTYYYFTAFEDGSDLLRSESYRLYVPAAVSTAVTDLRVTAKGKYTGVEIAYSLVGSESAQAELSYQDSSANFKQSLTSNVSLKKGNNKLFVPSYFGSGAVHASAVLNTIGDDDRSDDSLSMVLTGNYFQILPGKGFSFDGISVDTLFLWTSDRLLASAVDTAWLKLEISEALQSTDGILFKPGEHSYSLELLSDQVLAQLQTNETIFMRHPRIDSWELLDGSGGITTLNPSGVIARGDKRSTTGPETSLMLEGQLFFDGDYITDDTRIDIIGEDADGFTWKHSDIELLVNGDQLEVDLGDTTREARIMGVSADLQLNSGTHDISFRMRDALDNWSELTSITAVVASEARIVDYGNFPNPFQGETQIIYELTQPLEDVQIEIFTLAGYKVITIDEFDARVGISLGAIGYHEVPWNGRDRNDDFVANGVYFYRIKGALDGETLYGPIGKMVKNR